MPNDPFSPQSPNNNPNDSPFLAELVEKQRGRKSGSKIIAFLICCMVIGGITLFAIWFVPKEVQQWRIAALEERRLDGDVPGAFEQLDQEIAKYPENMALRQLRAIWLMENKQYREALTELDQIIAKQPEEVAAYDLRASVRQSLGQFREAVDDWKRILSFDSVAGGTTRPDALNALAYARGLADIEIDEGLVNIDEALRMRSENAAYLDTRGFLYYRKGDYDRALKDLDNAVNFADSLRSSTTSDPRKKAREDKKFAQWLAAIRYHRALVHDARNEKDAAEEDRRRVRELGFEPNDSLF